MSQDLILGKQTPDYLSDILNAINVYPFLRFMPNSTLLYVSHCFYYILLIVEEDYP